MPFDRPTFSESWYRVAELKPRLRTLVQSYRQRYRGQTWWVLRDPGNNKFYRLDEPSYRMVGLLDGQRSVDDVWRACQEIDGDHAPTQGEAIQLLGQLYVSNLISAEVPADAGGMFERYRKRKRREVGGYLMNLLFARIPIFDPEPILERWEKAVGWVFTPTGVALWLGLVGFALFQLAGHWDRLVDQTFAGGASEGVLAPQNLPLLWIMLVLTKVVHEFGHAFACKHFGKKSNSGGEVHTLGIMLMAFVPMPYVDASSAWALRNKWQRAFIGAAGMYAELAMAAVAAIVWVNTGQNDVFSQTVHALAYNTMFIAGMSTILFNANPLIRFDGYYILSDLTETPNLAQRSKDYVYYLVKKFIYKVHRPRDPSHTVSERPWFILYAVASFIYRIFITVAILLFVMSFEVFFFLGAIAAVMGVFSFLVMPLGKWMHYLLTNPELQRTRMRAYTTTGVFFAVLVLLLGVIRWPDWARAEGVVEPEDVRVVYATAPGFVHEVLASGTPVTLEGPVLFQAENLVLETRLAELRAERDRRTAIWDAAISEDVVRARAVAQSRMALEAQIADIQRDLDSLTRTAPLEGTWLAGGTDDRQGQFVRPGDAMGMVVTTDRVFIRIAADQTVGPLLREREGDTLSLRVQGRPDQAFTGRVVKVSEAGQTVLPSQALGYAAGGRVETDPTDQNGARARQAFFEVQIELDQPDQAALLSGQRVMARFDLPPATAIDQAWRSLVRAFRERRQS